MGKNYFTEEQQEQLRGNPYIKNISEKAITYTQEFREIFSMEYQSGKLPSCILKEMGIDPQIIGARRKDSIVQRSKQYELRKDGFEDARAKCARHPTNKNLTDAEKLKRLEQSVEYLKQENEFLKKKHSTEQTGNVGIQTSPSQRYQLIKIMTERDNNVLNIRWLCDAAAVSRSGYYNWINHQHVRKNKDLLDKEDFKLILEAFKFRGYDKGSRGIYMRLLQQGTVMNRKKIQRLMRKFKLLCPIRKANPYRRMAKALKTDSVSENLVKREFREHGTGMILLTDITYMFYGHGQKAYLSVIKDAYTKQVLSYVPSESLEVDFVLETVNLLIHNHGITLSEKTILHSDQGCHYTSISFRQLLKDKNLRQSMSRRGNCWDNAPQESFFGHMKDEIHLERCDTFNDLITQIDDYIDYYNTDRYQWGLAKLSPNQYAEYLKTESYPINKRKQESLQHTTDIVINPRITAL